MLDKSIPYTSVLMVKTDTQNYPHYDLPQGYSISGYQTGFDAEWAKLNVEIDHIGSLTEAENIFKNDFLSRPELLFKQCLFVLDKCGEVAAVASLWHGDDFGETFQRIHWVAASPRHQGKGLVKALMTRLMDIYNELGYKDFIYLSTQTWSYKAINIYSQFGFKPYMGEKPVNRKREFSEEKNIEAWRLIQQKIDEYKKRE